MDPTTSRLFAAASGYLSTINPITNFTTSSYIANTANPTITLTWNTLNAQSVSIDQGIGAVASTGTATTTVPMANVGSAVNIDVIYTLTAISLDGITYTSSLTVVQQCNNGCTKYAGSRCIIFGQVVCT